MPADAGRLDEGLQPSRPRGSALRLTEEQLAAMAETDEGDAVAAEALWKRLCPKWAKSLLQAGRGNG